MCAFRLVRVDQDHQHARQDHPRTTRTIGIIDQDREHARQDHPRTTRTIGIIDQDHHHARQDRPRTTRTIGFTDRTIDPSLDVIILILKWEGKRWSWSQREAVGLVNIVVRSSPKEGAHSRTT